ncbi:hypothetical protein P170DRAFT_1749 [Aspergillus steynii IBT 23096]|uniref:Uncharacterized protein n=1 Tax=Aspergillus steynii IBT 23096 TaxID=1392250 RepID=A0A2I2GLA6_9EURO|nr:uncharacterized protein P170DRAFT_1749 [Aspergillus steynii IBT 23096]PLB53665.1 hypothetical protein P170DRAFT_1749 [Aspergillus steynii IBT 23096]
MCHCFHCVSGRHDHPRTGCSHYPDYVFELINIGSTVALNALITLTIGSLLNSYIVIVACVAWRRISGEPLPPRHWSLGRWGPSDQSWSAGLSYPGIRLCHVPSHFLGDAGIDELEFAHVWRDVDLFDCLLLPLRTKNVCSAGCIGEA